MIHANASPVHIVVLMAVAEDVLPPQVYQVRSVVENVFLNSIDWEDYPVVLRCSFVQNCEPGAKYNSISPK